MTNDPDRRLRGAIVGLATALLPVVVLWGYTVDDALISARVASNIALGIGHRFNAGGPAVDAVTPLGWAYVLAPFAASGPLSSLVAAKILGAACWLAAAAWLGARVSGHGLRGLLALGPVAVCAPLAAWAVSGMETGVVTALATFALARSPIAPLFSGLAAAWRPELMPWAVALALGTALGTPSKSTAHRARRAGSLLALALGPALIIAIARQLAFGRPTPLALLAKPSDFEHGLAYALLAFGLSGPPWLAVAPCALKSLDRHERAVLAASALHFVSLVLAGGDWMVLWRLAVPVLPGFVLVGASLSKHARPWATSIRLAMAIFVSLWVFVQTGLPARSVGAHRAQLIERARPVLADARRVAALDAGWVGAATAAPVVDLAGLTDPVIAAFAGGHTSKRVPRGLLESRGVDTVVLLLAPDAAAVDPWQNALFARAVEHRVALLLEPTRWHSVGTLPLGGTHQRYLILRQLP